MDWIGLDGLDPLRSLVPLEHLAVLINGDRMKMMMIQHFSSSDNKEYSDNYRKENQVPASFQ